ncbi:MAG: bifunctional tetrahydrofolate synthase/dihydrofolate synthase [Pseudohongiellaceae bacterium]
MNNDKISWCLSEWLDYISEVHPREIELGLSRVKAVASALNLERPATKIVTIAGTNGKGTCAAYLEALLAGKGIRTGAYTSPHIHCFTERVRVNGSDVSEANICEAFLAIDTARDTVSLSYFEFATLAALWIFSRQNIQVALLEVGLGGRLDAVNIVDADIALITSIALDHEDWLGSDLEVIGFEKAGIMRSAKPAIFADGAMPVSIESRAKELDSPLYQLGKDFKMQLSEDRPQGELKSRAALWQSNLLAEDVIVDLSNASPSLHLGSLAACLQTLTLLEIGLAGFDVGAALAKTNLPGRFERRIHSDSQREIILDVAHNPAAAELLCIRIQKLRKMTSEKGRVILVLAVLADKDIEGIVVSLQSSVDIWYIAQNDNDRALPVNEALDRLNKVCPQKNFHSFESVEEACYAACMQAKDDDRIIIAGSFHTVAIAREHSRAA